MKKVFLTLCFVVILGSVVVTQVPSYRTAFAHFLLNHVLQKKGITVSFTKITQFSPFGLRADHVDVRYKDEIFLSADDFSLRASFQLKGPTIITVQGVSSYGIAFVGDLTSERVSGLLRLPSLGEIHITAPYCWSKEILEIKDYRIEGDGLCVYGSHSFFLDKGVSQGDLSFHCDDTLSLFTPFNVSLQGDIKGTVCLTSEQILHGRLHSNHLTWKDIGLENLEGDFTWDPTSLWTGGFSCKRVQWKSLCVPDMRAKMMPVSQGVSLDVQTFPTHKDANLRLKAILQSDGFYLSEGTYQDRLHQIVLAKPVTWTYQYPWPESSVELKLGKGTLSLSPASGSTQERRVVLNSVPLTVLSFLNDQWFLEGTLSGQGTINTGKDSSPYQFKLNAHTSHAHGNKQLIQTLSLVELHGDDQTLHWNLTTRGGAHLHLLGAGTWDWHQRSIESTLKGMIALDAVNAFLVHEDKLRGKVNLDLRARGSLDHPHLSGKISVVDGYYENGALGTIVKDIHFEGQIEESLLKLPKVTARDASRGTIQASGTIEFQQGFVPNFNLVADLKHVVLAQSDDLRGVADGKVSLKGVGMQAELRGTLEALSLVYDVEARNPRLPSLKIKGKRSRNVITPHKSDKLWIPLHLDVRLVNPMVIMGNNLRSQWRGELHLEKALSSPQVMGNLTLIDGRFDFLGKKLEATDGSVRFDKEPMNDPQLDIRAMREGTEITVYFQILGRASNPTFSFTSVPPLPMEEILARLIFNQSLGKTSSSQSLQIATALSSLQQAGGMNVFSKLQKVFGVDGIEFKQPEPDPNKSSLQGSVAVRKQLTERFSMNVESGLGADANKVGAEIKVTPHLSVEADVSSSENIGLGLNWSKRY